ncbi:MAG: ATP-binding protein [Proteobacteria bacterium]|nr:ATP-binding protein [Pseudomonadota bacterium]MBU1902404.1 ATP-binding protein [Pseudomonadota bacterium]
MQDLSLHILDIVENATSAGATLVEIDISEDVSRDILQITIQDNGQGMDAEMLRKVADPFVTTRTTRRVGMGVPLLEQAAKETGGGLLITSEPGKGTKVVATFRESHIDRRPLGDMGATLITLIMGNPDLDFIYTSNLGDEEIEVDTRAIRAELNGTIRINDPVVIHLIKDLFKN